MPTGDRKHWHFWLTAGAICALGLALRIPMLFNDLWLDEIWSLRLVREYAQTPLDVFTKLHIDNNHYLNSLFLFFLGEQHQWWIYRLPSLFFGMLTILLAGSLARKRGKAATIIVMYLFSISLLMILYATEARGYAAAIFFALLSLWLQRRGDEGKMPSWALIAFWAAITLGFLAHLTYIIILPALALRCISQQKVLGRKIFSALVLWFGPPCFFFICLFIVDISSMDIGAVASLAKDLPNFLATFTTFLGLPFGLWTFLLSIATYAVLSIAAWCMLRNDSHEKAFMTTLLWTGGSIFILCLPILSSPAQWHTKYALVILGFFLVTLGETLAFLWKQNRLGRSVAIAILILFTSTNSYQIFRLAHLGRGHYIDGLRFVTRSMEGADTTIGIIGDASGLKMMRWVIDYYLPYLSETERKSLHFRHFLPKQRVDEEAMPEWLLVQGLSRDALLMPSITLNQTPFIRVRDDSYASESGMRWMWYRRNPGNPS